MFTNQRAKNCPLIDDGNYKQFVDAPSGQSRGRVPRDWSAEPYASRRGSFESVIGEEIPRSDWAAIIQEQTETQTRLIDYVRKYPRELFVLDQDGTNYCWGNAPTMGAMILRKKQGLPPIRLSPASICAKIKGYRNVGGWGGEACDFATEHGWAPSSLWPDNEISRKRDTDQCRREALNFRLTESADLRPNSIGQLTTGVLRGFPVPVGYDWWGHEVLCLGVSVLGRNEFAWDIANSWSLSWGDQGFGQLAEGRAAPQDAVCMRQMLAYLG